MKSLVLVALCGFFSWGYSVTVETKGLPRSRLFSVDVRGDTIWVLAQLSAHSFGEFRYGSKEMVYKSDDGGASWSGFELDDDDDTWEIRFVTDTLGFVMADSRIYKTTDGGETWTRRIFSGASVPYRFYIKSETELIAIYNNGTFLSKDGGDTWEPYLVGNSANDIYFLDDNVGFLSVNTIAGGEIYKTVDGGESYYRVFRAGTDTYGYLNKFHFFDTQRGIAMDVNYVYGTEDGGETWDVISNDLKDAGINLNISDMVFEDDQNGMILGDFVFRTGDGGKTWEQVSFGEKNSYWGLAKGTEAGEVVVVGDSILRMNFDGDILDEFLLTAPSENVAFTSSEEGWGIYSNRLIRTQDGGDVWRYEESPEMEGKEVYELTRAKDGTLVALGGEGYFWKLPAGETSWEGLSVGVPGKLTRVEFLDATTGWCLVEAPAYKLYATRDGGVTWVEQGLPEEALEVLQQYSVFAFDFHFVDERLIWLRLDKRLWKSQDGGESWEAVSGVQFEEGQSPYFGVLASGSDTVFVSPAFSSSPLRNEPPSLASYDGGKTWKSLDNDFFAGGRWFVFENPCIGYGFGDALSITEDGGRSWSEIDFDLSEIVFAGSEEPSVQIDFWLLSATGASATLSGSWMGRMGTDEWGKVAFVTRFGQIVRFDFETERKEEVAFYEFGLERPYPLTLSFESEAGASYIIEKSHDMEHWERDCGTVVADGDRMEWMDATLDDPETLPRFYRVMELVAAE